ncbi:TPA: spore coat protein [Clostridium botulinum]|uniref:cytidylyltransferase domain-containing protein n=1 Tax=Clostridium botulinum TaxID=1491 RepID=UPI0029BEAD91|nr:spore coat protein [Clostridium botulinum]HDK7177434.1 spore coat protein [Clostridium botulinum]HDK7189055.1 spore coat protein [Clostridium botulinum]HDK7216276.1 spore coat protein [Clostridium botulinum]HDK7222918.1 spore coat protein [Clostridium botulinum]
MNLLIIQAHIGSTRLPGKIMKNICGKEVLLHVYERCVKAKEVNKIIIATSKNTKDNQIEKFCKKHNIECFRGSESDVLDRYYECAKRYNPDYIVRVTSDCPLLEPKLIDYWIKNAVKDNIDFVEEEKELFIGFGLDIFSYNALERMKNRASENKQKEHVVGYYYDNKNEFIHNKYLLEDELKYLYRPYRLTLDTIEDFNLINAIYEKFYENDYVELNKVMNFLDTDKSMLNINNNVCQKNYFRE